MKKKYAGVVEVSGKTRTSPQVIAKTTPHFLVVECDSKYIINQNCDLSTFMRKNWRLKMCVPSHWSNRENNRHYNSRENVTQGMNYRTMNLISLL